jgi:hypothetical protein
MDLTNEEKINIINQHIKSSMVNSFNLHLSIIEEGTQPTPNQNTISKLQEQLDVENKKQEALQNEIASLN